MKVSIIGVMGYSGLELFKILENHPKVEIVSIHGTQNIGESFMHIFPGITHKSSLKIEVVDTEKIMAQADLVFFATPSGISGKLAQPFIEASFPVIDLSGDYRLPKELYEEWYEKEAPVSGLSEAVYGLSEFIENYDTNLIANPGCYATATLLGLAPLAKAQLIKKTPIIDAKSGLTGAGKNLSSTSHFISVNENMNLYKVNQHQHIPEIMEQLKEWQQDVPLIQFTTSLIPISRGILATMYLEIEEDPEMIHQLYQNLYLDKPFVEVRPLGILPEIKEVVGSNVTSIGLVYNEKTKILTIVTVLDNLMKGAAGQGVQNLNILMGIPETTGLNYSPSFI